MFPSCLDFTVSLGEISCRLHLAQRQSRVPCIYFSHSSLCGFSCHFGSVLCEWCLPSGATHAGEYILPGHWKENLTSAMLILAVMSSSICGNEEHRVMCHFLLVQFSGATQFLLKGHFGIRAGWIISQKATQKSQHLLTITLLLLR